MMEPPPPGIVPNFPPHYPFKWQQKIMPEPHPNHLQSMGLPRAFSAPRRSNPGYGGYQYCRGYEEDQGSRDHNNGYHGGNNGDEYNEENYSNEYSHGDDYGNPFDENEEYDHDETWQDEGEWDGNGDQEYGINQGRQSHEYDPNLVPIYGAPAPAPRTKNHYYNLAPRPLSGASGSTNNGFDNNAPNVPSQRSKKQEPSEGKKKHLRMVYGDRYCEGCNYGFHSLEKFQEHLESHVKCPFTGCGLETTIERLDEHITVAHILNPAASKQIDTAEYIRQRRNNFPSVQRAQLKTALAEQQKKRGEILALDHRWEKKEVQDRNGDNAVENNDIAAGIEAPTPEVDSFHVDSHEYEPVSWTEPSNRNYVRKQDSYVHANAKRKLMESSRQRAMVKRRKDAFHRKREVMVEREVDVLSRIPAFCGIEEYREETNKGALASTLAQDDASQFEANTVFHISDDEDDFPSARVSRSPLKNSSSDAAQSSYNTSNSHLTNPVKGLSGEEVSRQAMVIPAVPGSALGLLLGDYGTDSEEEDSGSTCLPTVEDCTPLLSKPAVSVLQEPALDLHDNSKSSLPSAADGGTSGVVEDAETASDSNTHSFDVGGVRGIEGSSPDSFSTMTNVALEASSESEKEIIDAKVLGAGEGSKRRRRGKRGKKKKKCQVSGAEGGVGDSNTIHNNNKMHESSKCIGEGILKCNSEIVTSPCLRSKVVVPSLAPHLKPLNKKEVDSEDEGLETASRERLPTTRWAEDKIFSYQLKGQYKKFKNNYRKSLLVELLGDEVVRERNIIMQCAKFIVQNDFFEQKKLHFLPQSKPVLVDGQTNGEDVKENANSQAEPDSEDLKKNTITPGDADCEYVKEKSIIEGEPDSEGGKKNNKQTEADSEGVVKNNRQGEPDNKAMEGNNSIGEPDSEGVKENNRQSEHEGVNKNILGQATPNLGITSSSR